MSHETGTVRLDSMKPHELERLKRAVAIELARKALESADWSRGYESLTENQRSAYDWLESLYYDGEITYRELWALCPRYPLPNPDETVEER